MKSLITLAVINTECRTTRQTFSLYTFKAMVLVSGNRSVPPERDGTEQRILQENCDDQLKIEAVFGSNFFVSFLVTANHFPQNV